MRVGDKMIKRIPIIVFAVLTLGLSAYTLLSEALDGVRELSTPVIDSDTEFLSETASEPSVAVNIFTVAIDPGHQASGDSQREPIGPGATEYKARVAPGTRGVSTRVPEYQLVLDVSLLLRDELITRGFNVFMIRETNDVNISNRERAIMATEAGVEIFVRVHANAAPNSDAHGMMTLSPSRNNQFIPDLYIQSRALSDYILLSMVSATGARNLGVLEIDDMTGINWATVPVAIIELGFMTNPTEDKLMQTDEYQQKLVMGIANGIERFFAENSDR